ncbi:MAG: alpha/beta fold hydrolase [Hyphomonadaceae bacterium]
MSYRFGPDFPDITYVPHAYAEKSADLGEIAMNYATAGSAQSPALVLIPGQTESWWGYEAAMKILEADFQVFAIDLRGQGRSTRTPGRYTLDNIAGDVVRFIQIVVGRPCFVSGLSSGGVISAWLSAFAPPGLVRAAIYEDPPLYASQVSPACGPSIREAIGPIFALWARYLGPQWSIGDWDGCVQAMASGAANLPLGRAPPAGEPPQNMKEYDPEWAHAFWTGSVYAGCDHDTMLKQVKTPVLFTHHFRRINEETGALFGAISDIQAARVKRTIEEVGQLFTYRSFPDMGHAMHAQDPALYARTVKEWLAALDER